MPAYVVPRLWCVCSNRFFEIWKFVFIFLQNCAIYCVKWISFYFCEGTFRSATDYISTYYCTQFLHVSSSLLLSRVTCPGVIPQLTITVVYLCRKVFREYLERIFLWTMFHAWLFICSLFLVYIVYDETLLQSPVLTSYRSLDLIKN